MTEEPVRISTDLYMRARALGWTAKPDPEFPDMVRLSRAGGFRRTTLEQTLEFIKDSEREQAELAARKPR